MFSSFLFPDSFSLFSFLFCYLSFSCLFILPSFPSCLLFSFILLRSFLHFFPHFILSPFFHHLFLAPIPFSSHFLSHPPPLSSSPLVFFCPSLLVVNVREVLEGIEKKVPSFRGLKFSGVDLRDLGQCVSYCRPRGWSVLYGVDEVCLFVSMVWLYEHKFHRSL